MSENPWTEWAIELPLDFVVGETYVVRANHNSGKFWADFLITITERTQQGDFGFKAETMLDGSPGLMDGWDGAKWELSL